MNEITYTEQKPKMAKGTWFGLHIYSLMFCLLMLVSMDWPLIRHLIGAAPDPVDGSFYWWYVVLGALCWLNILIWVILLASWFRNRNRLLYRLSIGQDGLTYAHDLQSWHWSWRDLPPFEHIPARWYRAGFIRCRLKDPKVEGTRARRIYLAATFAKRFDYSLFRGWKMYLLDNFNLPLAELTTKLNEHRDRALGYAGAVAALDRPPT